MIAAKASSGQGSYRRRRDLGRWVHVAESRWRDPQIRKQATLAVLFTAAVGSFLNIVEDYLDHDPIVRWDVEFSRWLHIHKSDGLFEFFKVYTYLGNVAWLALLTLAVSIFLLRRRAVTEAALMAGSAVGIEVLNGGLKLLFHRPRPELAYVHLDTYSFPSGHSAGATAIYGVALYLLISRSSHRLRAYVGAGALFLIGVGLIAFSRLYLEVHYLSDVLAGCSLGLAWATGCLFGYEARRTFDLEAHLPARAVDLLDRVAQRSKPAAG